MHRLPLRRRTFLTMLAATAGSALLAAGGSGAAADAQPTTAGPAALTARPPLAPSRSAVSHHGATGRTLTGALGGATYRIDVPAHWNGTLALYSHGYVAPAWPANPPTGASDPPTAAALLAHGYALAGSAYRDRGWIVPQAYDDQLTLLDFASQQLGPPTRVIAWGDSLGGLISAQLVQRHPDRFAGALPMDGVLKGGVATLNAFLDVHYTFKVLLAPHDPALPLTHFTQADATTQHALDLFTAAQRSPAGRARIALAAAFGQLPDWFGTTKPHPAPTDAAGRQQALAQWVNAFPLSIAIGMRADVERRVGGNPSFNTGVSYTDLFARAPQRELIDLLYRRAGLSLAADLTALDRAPRITADAGALAALRRSTVFDGALSVPVLTLHTTGDGAMPVEADGAYADVVRAAGNARLLRQLFVARAGHGTFTPAERVAAFSQLIRRLDTGQWDDAALAPQTMNSFAQEQSAAVNAVTEEDWSTGKPVTTVTPMPPAFVAFAPAPLLRPFDARTPNPAG